MISFLIVSCIKWWESSFLLRTRWVKHSNTSFMHKPSESQADMLKMFVLFCLLFWKVSCDCGLCFGRLTFLLYVQTKCWKLRWSILKSLQKLVKKVSVIHIYHSYIHLYWFWNEAQTTMLIWIICEGLICNLIRNNVLCVVWLCFCLYRIKKNRLLVIDPNSPLWWWWKMLE